MELERRAFSDICPVSYETLNKLSLYQEMLISWNAKMNLVAKSTLSCIWTRHFLDSAQLFPLIPTKAFSLADLGAGAGFPGLVLAILAQDKGLPLHVHAIESTKKKASFLQAVVNALSLPATIHDERIESIKNLKADVITARALTALPDLLEYGQAVSRKESLFLFLKGRTVSEELTAAQKYWTFGHELHPSCSDKSGNILVIKNLRRAR